MTAGDGGNIRVWDIEAKDLRGDIARHDGVKVKQVRKIKGGYIGAGAPEILAGRGGTEAISLYPTFLPYTLLQVRTLADGRVVSAGDDGQLMVWEAGSKSAVWDGVNRPLGQPPAVPTVVEAHSAPISCLAVSRDGKRVATGAGAWEGTEGKGRRHGLRADWGTSFLCASVPRGSHSQLFPPNPPLSNVRSQHRRLGRLSGSGPEADGLRTAPPGGTC